MKYNIQEYPTTREKKYEWINEAYPNVSHQYERASHAENYFYCRNINSPPDIIPNWNHFLGCCGNCIKKKHPNKKVKIHTEKYSGSKSLQFQS